MLENLDWIILFMLLAALAVSILMKKLWLVVLSILALVLFGLYIFFRKRLVSFFFINDDANIEAHPELYCGENLMLPDNYDRFGTRYKCLKKGVGTGMSLPSGQRDAFLAKTRNQPTERVYCGDSNQLPQGYNRNGNLSECFRRGVGIGLGMPQEKRLAFQQQPVRIGKRELINLAEKFKIDYNVLTRRQTADLIGDRIRNVEL